MLISSSRTNSYSSDFAAAVVTGAVEVFVVGAAVVVLTVISLVVFGAVVTIAVVVVLTEVSFAAIVVSVLAGTAISTLLPEVIWGVDL